MMRIFYLALGFFLTALGFIGVFVPLLPTVLFLILAAWCFARSSPRFHDWLYYHPRFGKPVQDWTHHRVIPKRAKIVACAMMAGSYGTIIFTTMLSPWLYVLIAVCLLAAAVWLITRPSFPEGLNKP